MFVGAVHLVLVLKRLVSSFIEETCADEGLCHSIRITVGGRPAVLKVALLLVAHVPGDADAGAAVGHASRELVDVGCLVETRQAPGIVQPSFGVVGTDVVLVTLAQPLDGLFNVPVKGARRRGRHSECLMDGTSIRVTADSLLSPSHLMMKPMPYNPLF